MKITTTQKDLARGLATVGHASTSHSTLPILANIHLATEAGRLRLYATNLEIGIACWIEAQVHEEGTTTVPFKLTTELVSSLAQGPLELTCDQESHTMYIKAGRSSATIRGLPPEEFPQRPDMGESEAPIVIEAGLLKEVVGQIAFAAAEDDSRPVLTGVHMQFSNGKLTLAAADSFRLAFREIPMACSGEPILVPARTLEQLSRIIPAEGPVAMLVSRNRSQVLFHCEGLDMTSRLIEGTFPNFRQIVPKECTTRATVETKAFLSAVRSVMPFARDSSNIARIRIEGGGDGGIEPGTVTIEATADEVGNNVTSINAAVDGPEQKVIFNARYLADFAAALDCAEMSLELTSATRPGVIRPLAESTEYKYVVMPLSTNR